MTHIEIKSFFTRLVLIVAIGLSPPAVIATERQVMPSFRSTYEVRYGLLRGTMTFHLDRRDSGYVYETSLRPAGVAAWFKRGAIIENTTLETVDGAIVPLDYYGTDTIANPVRKTYYRFDHQGDRVFGEYKSQTIDLPMRAGGHNRISVHIAVMSALQSNANLSGLSVFDRGRWKDYRFTVDRGRTASTRAGTFDTVEVRYASDGRDRSWSMHFAPDVRYLPVMLDYYEDGKLKSRAQLSAYWIDDEDIDTSE